MRDIFNYVQTGTLDDGTVTGDFIKQKGIPRVYDKIKRKGILTLDDIFQK